MSTAPATTRRHQTHCKRGHAKDVDNIYIKPDGSYMCRACMQIRSASRHASTRVSDRVDGVTMIGMPWEDLAAAITRQAITDYEATGDESALDFLAYCGLLTHNCSVRRH